MSRALLKHRHGYKAMEPPELEIADYELLLQVYKAWNPTTVPPPANEGPDAYQARIRSVVYQQELRKEFYRVLKKLRKVIVGHPGCV